jgi:hypothetical protein
LNFTVVEMRHLHNLVVQRRRLRNVVPKQAQIHFCTLEAQHRRLYCSTQAQMHLRYLVDLCLVHLQGTDTPSSEGIVAWRVISKQILLRQ